MKVTATQTDGFSTNYITKFQTITANLDWDDEALEDKFGEGLKQNIRDELISL